MKKTKYLILIALLLLLASCTNTIKAPDDSWDTIFQQYWDAMNTEYVHFSDDTSFDWDAVYDEYEPKFAALDYTNKEDSLTAFKYFKEIAVNVYDYHYNLKVTDAFGQSLSCSPAILKKYKANGGDIMDFPDLVLVGNHGVPYPTSVNNSGRYYDGEDKLKEYTKAIPSFYEVETLKGDPEKMGNEYGYFHNPGNKISDEFGTSYYGYTFEAFKDEYISSLESDDDKKLAFEWNVVVKAIAIDSYFYGVNKDNVFYLYFSDFGNIFFLYDIFTKTDEEMTETDKTIIASSTELALIRTFTRNLIEYAEDEGTSSAESAEETTTETGNLVSATVVDGYVNANTLSADEDEGTSTEAESTTTDSEFKKKIQAGVAGIKGISDMYVNLLSATAEEKCKINNIEKDKIVGVAIDLRGNGGGAVAFLDAIWGAFFSSGQQVGYVRYKAGYSRNEYTPWVTMSIDDDFKNEGLKSTYDKPVAVIVNGFSVSCSELSCVISKLLPNSKIVGHQTYGGTCGLTDRTIYNSGPFTSAHLSIYTTTYQFVDNNKKSFETIGFTPDIETELSETVDNAYIEAIKWVAQPTTTN